MILADTSAWIEYLRKTGSTVNHAHREALRRGEVATTDAVVLEILAGTTDDLQHRRLKRLLERCFQLPQRPWGDAEAGAALYRACRKRGETPRSQLDCVIAAVAIRKEIPVLHRDRDFTLIARHSMLTVIDGS